MVYLPCCTIEYEIKHYIMKLLKKIQQSQKLAKIFIA